MDDLQKRITEAANHTWQAIGGDVLRSAEADWLPAEDVAECVLDYLDQYGGDSEAVAAFGKLPFEERMRMLRKAFPLSKYGW
jgi:hypothetical protein